MPVIKYSLASSSACNPIRSTGGASARSNQLVAQSYKCLLLGPLHRHRTDLQPSGYRLEDQRLEERESQGRARGAGKLIDQLLQRQRSH